MPLAINDAHQFCIRCGGVVVASGQKLEGQCKNCGYVEHFNPITAVGVVIYGQSGEVVFIRRNRDPGRGKLGLPGGFVDLGETAERAAIREVKEEIGVDVDGLEFLATFPNEYVYQDVVVPVLDIFFSVQAGELASFAICQEEVSEALVLPLSESTLSQIAFRSNRQALETLKAKFRF